MSDLAGTVVPAEFLIFCEGSGTDSTKFGRKMRKMSKMNTITSNFSLKYRHHACRPVCNTILLYSIKWVKCMKYINPLFMDYRRIRQRKPLSPSPKLSSSSIFQRPPPTHFSIHQSVASAYLPLSSGSLEPTPPVYYFLSPRKDRPNHLFHPSEGGYLQRSIKMGENSGEKRKLVKDLDPGEFVS
jgi:hypothetical protein